jgi:hypothetical protein
MSSRERGYLPSLNWEWSSRLGVSWANGVWLEGRPQVKRAQPTFSGPRVSGSGLWWRELSVSMISRVRSWSSVTRARSFFALSNRGWYSASSAGVSRRVMVLPPDLAGPFGVGAVQAGRVSVAAAVRLAAGVGADGEGAGQGEARLGEPGGDPVPGRALGCGWFHAPHRLRSAGPRAFHSIFLWTGGIREASCGQKSTR